MMILYLLIGGLLLLTVWGLYCWEILPRTKKNAEWRAEQLLSQHVTPQQYQQLQQDGYIEIPSRLHPNRLYRIFRRRQRVQVYTLNPTDDGEPWRKHSELCVIACEPVPDADLFLAHKWMIESDEGSYLALANHVHAPVHHHRINPRVEFNG
jgi:hypothetical protein